MITDKLLEDFIKIEVKQNNKLSDRQSRWDFTYHMKESIANLGYMESPYELSWQLTNRCNLNCNYCYAESSIDDTTNELSTEKCHDLIEQFKRYKIYDITLEGGEVFLREDILELIEHLKENGIFIDILTNGFLISEKIVEKLGQLLDRRVDGIQISLDFTDQEGIHKQLKLIIKNLILKGVNVRVNVVLTKENTENLKKIYLQTYELGVRGGFSVSDILPIGRGKKVEKPSVEEMFKSYIDIKKMEFEDLPITSSPFIIESLSNYQDIFNKIKRNSPNVKRKICSAGKVKVNVASNGDVYPCVFLQYPEFLMGNINKKSLYDIWHSKKAASIRKKLTVNTCIGCSKKTFCPGGCIGVAYALHKNLLYPDSRCLKNYHG
ncbi:hypothetical protein Y919_11040 [Caloranaerobacter azorensis H53214]|uniref:Radical SAM core domain-containing protein n=1 Tax=Caloranaerobacter azorensis H53214 TaxID=1156417 RepID=A0A096BEN7_9FIRM|nr:radical SAM protein [Caloranaerobacter azorensis]KGG79610.1 hypothetical protein Y919_11040 [Caloranaerobacter azorensis H53214]